MKDLHIRNRVPNQYLKYALFSILLLILNIQVVNAQPISNQNFDFQQDVIDDVFKDILAYSYSISSKTSFSTVGSNNARLKNKNDERSRTISDPTGPSANDVSTCSGSEVTLTATGTGTIKWYDAATGGNLLFQGATFVTPALLSNTTYYLQDDNFSGTRTPVNVTILFGSICGSVIDNVFTLKLPSGGTTIFDLNTLISGNTLTLIVANTQNSLVLASDVNGISTNGTSTITVDLGEFSTFAGLSVLGNSGTDLVTIGASGLDFSELPGADNQLININLSSATDQLTVFGPIKTKGTGDLYIQSGLGFDIGATLTTLDTLTIHSGGTVTQSSAISSKTLMLGKTGNTGTYILTNSSNNAVDLRAVATGSISYTDMDGIIVRNATTAGDVTISAGGNISVENTGIQMNSGSGSVELTNSSGTITIKGNGIRTKGNVTVNSVGTISSVSRAIDNTSGTGFISLTSTGGGITSGGNGLQSKGAITLSAAGNIAFSGESWGNSSGSGNISLVTSSGTLNPGSGGMKSSGDIILSAPGNITIGGSGISNTNGNITVTSLDNGIAINGQGVTSTGDITIQAKGAISSLSSSVNAFGKLSLISSEAGITTDGTGLRARDEMLISAGGNISFSGGATRNNQGTGGITIITSSGTVNTGLGGIDSKGKISISGTGNITIGDAGITNTTGTESVDVSTSEGQVAISGQGIRTSGNVTVNSGGAISSINNSIDNTSGTGSISLTSTGGGITSGGNGLQSKGTITLSAAGNIAVSGLEWGNSSGSGDISLVTTSGTVNPGSGGMRSRENIILTAPGRITIQGNGIANTAGTGTITVNSSEADIIISNQGVNSNGDITIQAKGQLTASGSSVRGTGKLSLISLEGGITTDGTGVRARDEMLVSAAGNISFNGGATSNSLGTGGITIITSSGTINSGPGGINSKGKISLSGTGNITISNAGITNTYGTDSVKVNTSAGNISISESGIESKGPVLLNAFGTISVSGGGVNNTYGTDNDIWVTSSGDKIELTDAGLKSNGKVVVEADKEVNINRGGIQNFTGSGNITIKSETAQVSVFNCTNCSDTNFGVKSLGIVTIEADAISLTGPVNANTSAVYLKPVSNDMIIDLGGTEAVGILGISGTELGWITASEIIIGDETNTSEIVVNTALSADVNLAFLTATTTGVLNLKESLTVSSAELSGINNYQTSILTSTTSNQLTVTESVDLGSELELKLAAVVSGLTIGDKIMLIDYQGNSPISGTFKGLAEGAKFDVIDSESNTVTFKISYAGGDGNDVELEATLPDLQIIVDSKSKILGAKDPEFTLTYSLAQGEIVLSKLIGDPVFERESGETVGAYEITASGITSDFYEIIYVAGNLTILGPPSFLSNPTILEIEYGENYKYVVSASEEGDLETIISEQVLPSWLEFSNTGASQSAVLASFQEGDGVMSMAGDGEGNIFAMTFDGTRIFKVSPDGTYDTWASGLSQKGSLSMAVDSEYLYIGITGSEQIQDAPSLLRIPITNPSAGEEVWLTRQEIGGGVLKIISNGDHIYAAVFQSDGGIKKIHKQTKAIENFISGDLVSGFTFDENEDFYFTKFTTQENQATGIFKYNGETVDLLVPTESLGAFPITIEKSQDGSWFLSYIKEEARGGVRKYVSDFSSFEEVVPEGLEAFLFGMFMTPTGSIVYRDISFIGGDYKGAFEIYTLSAGATLTGIPAKSDIGDHPVTLRATNEAGSEDQKFVIRVVDKTSPVVTTFSPTNNATEVALQPTLSITFDEEVVLGNSGIVKLGKVGIDGCTIESFLDYDLSDVNDRSEFLLSGDKLTVSFAISEKLPANTQVIVEIPTGFVSDLSENEFAGFTAISYTWSFTTRDKYNQTITFGEIGNKTYGDDTFTIGNAETDQGLTVTYTAEDPTLVSITGNQATILKTGSTKITATQEGDDLNFAAIPVERTLTVNMAALVVTTDLNQGKTYATAEPVLTFMATGFVNEDNETIFTGSLARAEGEEVGAYAISQGTLSAGNNYSIAFTGDDFNITLATISGIEFNGESFVFDGTAKSLAIEGTLPEGTSVVYSNNSRTDVGSQTATATITGVNFTTLELTATLAITPAMVTGVEFRDESFIYDGTSKSLEIIGELPAGTSVAYSNNSLTNVGSQTVTATITGDNYTTLELTANLAITPATISGIEFNSDSFVYNGTAKSLAIEGTLPDGTSVAYSNNSRTDVGSQTMTATISGSNYTTLDLTATLAITSATVTGIEFKEDSFIYDGTSKSLEIIGELPAGTSVEYSNNSLTNVGTQTVTATITGSNYTKKELTATLAITPATITGVELKDDSFIYDGISKSIGITGALPIGTSVAYSNNSLTNVGSQTATASITGANYTTLELTATLAITPATVKGVEFKDDSFVYDGTSKSLVITGVLPEGTSVAYSNNSLTNVGTNVVTATISGLNYKTLTLSAELKVTPASVLITASDKSKVYGEANPALTFTYTGLVNGDTQVATELSIATTATASSNVGIYPITLTGAADANYDIILVNGTLTVGQKAVTITAENKSKVYGEANLALTFTYTGLVNGDTQVATEPGITTTATASSNVGIYPITLVGGVDANYDITLVNGTLTVGQKAVTITAENKSKVYGEANPALTFTYTGLVNGDEKVATEPSIATSATASSSVETYPITLTGGVDANYDIILVNGTLTVGQKAVTITAEDKNKIYGEENPNLTFTYAGLVNGHEKVATEPSISTTATASSNVGTYPITLTGAADANYDITLVAGQLEVTQATLTITADEGQSKIFGTADPVLSYSATGFAAGDDEQVLTGTLTRDVGEVIGTYPINLGSLAAGGNYQIVYTSADFEIIPAVIESVMQPAPIETVWGVYPGLPSTVTVMITDGQFLSLPITWDLQTLYVFGNGEYPLTATINLPSGILNTEALTVEIVVTVLPKPAPENILLDNNSFEAEAGQNFIAVGNLTVIDPIDNQHDISLADMAFDNVYFQINNGTLFWNSAERADGRTEFKVLVRVQDRDGNILEKEFTIIRNRTSVSNIEIFNSFTPNGDNVNDTWGVEALRFYKGVSIQVFDRGGERVFYTVNPDVRWDGTFNNKELPIGTYYWTIEVGETGEVRKGMLNLLRK